MGSASYLAREARPKVIAWLQEPATLSLEVVRADLAEPLGVRDQSRQSSDD